MVLCLIIHQELEPEPEPVLFLKGRSRSRRKSGGSETLLVTGVIFYMYNSWEKKQKKTTVNQYLHEQVNVGNFFLFSSGVISSKPPSPRGEITT